ncbi:MAG: hypothetical protein ACI81R_003123 [Bradymonadia bacterium]|jgi:hypothetical protein
MPQHPYANATHPSATPTPQPRFALNTNPCYATNAPQTQLERFAMMTRPLATALLATALLAAACLSGCNDSRSGAFDDSDTGADDGDSLDASSGDAATDALVPVPSTPWPSGAGGLAVLFPADIEPLAQVGQALDMGLRSDGTRVLVVGDNSSDPGDEMNFVGRVTVFTQAPGETQWVEEASLRPSDPSQQLSMAVSVAYEDDVVVAGAVDFPGDPGRVYVFERIDGEWRESARIESPPTSDEGADNFGSAIDINNGRIAVSAASRGSQVGDDIVWILERTNGEWEPAAVLRSPDNGGDAFGRSLSLDGDRIAIGDNTFGGTLGGEVIAAHGVAYVFDRRDDGAWILSGRLTPANAQDYDAMGRSISLRGDMLAVGAPGSWGINLTGTVRIFEFEGGEWSETASFTGSATDLHHEFGAAVALDPPNLLVGALLEENGARATGGAYLFSLDDGEWSERVHWQPPTDETQQGFGYRVALLGDTAAIASTSDDSGAQSGGAIFVATRP